MAASKESTRPDLVLQDQLREIFRREIRRQSVSSSPHEKGAAHVG